MSVDELEFDEVPATPEQVRAIERECDDRVAELKAQGVEPVQRAAMTADLRQRAGLARRSLFAAITAGKGKPASYGSGSREKVYGKGKK